MLKLTTKLLTEETCGHLKRSGEEESKTGENREQNVDFRNVQ